MGHLYFLPGAHAKFVGQPHTYYAAGVELVAQAQPQIVDAGEVRNAGAGLQVVAGFKMLSKRCAFHVGFVLLVGG